MKTSLPPILLILAAAVLWSTGGLFVKATQLDAFELSLGRSLLAAVTVAYLTRREGFRLTGLTVITAFLYAGLLLFFVVATKLTTAANAIFLQYTAPVYVLLLEPVMFKEKFRRSDIFVVVACLCGMSLFFVGQLRPQDVQGNLTALASGLCFAFFMLLMRHPRARHVNRASSVIYGNLLLALLVLPVIFARAGSLEAVAARVADLTARDLMIVLFLGVVQIGVGYTLFTRGIERGVRSLDVGIVGYIEPVLNPVWVYLFIGERPSRWALVGGAIIITAVAAHQVHSQSDR
jgi:drug/metabolite transporter (DMT)-like permease